MTNFSCLTSCPGPSIQTTIDALASKKKDNDDAAYESIEELSSTGKEKSQKEQEQEQEPRYVDIGEVRPYNPSYTEPDILVVEEPLCVSPEDSCVYVMQLDEEPSAPFRLVNSAKDEGDDTAEEFRTVPCQIFAEVGGSKSSTPSRAGVDRPVTTDVNLVCPFDRHHPSRRVLHHARGKNYSKPVKGSSAPVAQRCGPVDTAAKSGELEISHRLRVPFSNRFTLREYTGSRPRLAEDHLAIQVRLPRMR